MSVAGSLAASFRRLIASDGPISIQRYMGEANARYYSSRDPLGSGGDFVTAPEISQMFGELIGLWLADIWRRAGAPASPLYVELGPGRGTLASDALRAMAAQGLRPEVHLVEASPALRSVQAHVLPQARWHADLGSVPEGAPLLLVANEFLDALPVRQLVKTAGGWRERMVGLEGERFVPVAGSQPMDAAVPPAHRDAPEGTILETCPGAAAVVRETARQLARQGGTALFIDYGHAERRTGSTLQAVRAHRKVDPFDAPGEADLTALVDFSTLAEVAQAEGCRWLGIAEQGAWLRALGIEARAQALAARAPEKAGEIDAACERLVAPDQMGALFKVMALAAPGWPVGAGL